MNPFRTVLGFALVVALTACNNLPVAPGETSTPTATQTPVTPPPPTATITPTPLPTPSPLTRIQSGDQLLFYGDYENALREFESAYRGSSDPQVQAAALWGLARTEFADARYASARGHLENLLLEFPDSAFVPYASFLLGETYFLLKLYPESAEAYDQYLQLRPGVLDAYVQEMRGSALYESGNYPAALTAYSTALDAPQIGDTLSLEIKVAQTRVEVGDYAAAIAAYDAINANTGNDYIKAQMDYLSGMAYQELGQDEQAQERFLHAVENYPLSIYAYLSLVELVAADVPVSDLDRGLVDYFAAQYDVALAAFDRYIEQGLDSAGTARYYRALTQRELRNYEAALNGLDDFIASYQDHPRWAEAWRDKSAIQWINFGDYLGGAQTLLDFVAAAPANPEAVDALMSAARIYERDQRLEEAANTWQRVSNEYPDNFQVPQALFQAGIAQYRRGDYHQALPLFQRSLVFASLKEDQSRAYLWIGKTHGQLNDQAAQQEAWQQAQAIDPTGYYSERTRDLLIGRAPFAEPSVYNIDIDLAKERADAASWVRVTFDLPAGTDLDGLGNLAADPRLIRGTEFWELGMYDQARLEFEDLREAVSASAENSFRLGNYLLDLGMYRTAIFASRQVLTLAGLDDQTSSLKAPPYFNHVRYGLYYSDLVVPNAETYDLHPLFMFSVMRQESLFEGFVRSTAGARGLMQIIPSTGAGIARSLGWPVAFKPDDLYRPVVSIRLGAAYLDSNRELLDNDLYAALAAYNAGPGNAAIWKDLAGDDPDLLLEIIRFQETRDYIRYIYEIYTIYRTLYSPVN